METADYRAVIGKTAGLRRGLTTGTCAAAAAKAAALRLLYGVEERDISITLPPGKRPYSGKIITLPVNNYKIEGNAVHACIVKDAGDDEDITGGTVIAARVVFSGEAKISITGGEGVGVVTMPGLLVSPGLSAINPSPLRMIRGELEPLHKGFAVEIYVPDGKKLSEKTWNKRLGIEGGISILGNSGVVEPKSNEAFKASIIAGLKVMRADNASTCIITPGYVGERYLFEKQGIPPVRVSTVGDHIGWTADRAVRMGFRNIVIVGHIGKIAKLAAGIMNTHWRSGDGRLAVIAAWTAYEGLSTDTVRKILSFSTAEEAASLLKKAGVYNVFDRIASEAVGQTKKHMTKPADLSCVILDLSAEVLGAFPGELKKDELWKSFMF